MSPVLFDAQVDTIRKFQHINLTDSDTTKHIQKFKGRHTFYIPQPPLTKIIFDIPVFTLSDKSRATRMTLSELQIVPLRSEDLDDRVKNFKSLNADVCKVMPDILLATMNMLFAQYQKIKGNNEYIPRYQDGSMEMQLKHLRDQAKCITNFTGMLPYRMPGDTNSRLVQMEILMH